MKFVYAWTRAQIGFDWTRKDESVRLFLTSDEALAVVEGANRMSALRTLT